MFVIYCGCVLSLPIYTPDGILVTPSYRDAVLFAYATSIESIQKSLEIAGFRGTRFYDRILGIPSINQLTDATNFLMFIYDNIDEDFNEFCSQTLPIVSHANAILEQSGEITTLLSDYLQRRRDGRSSPRELIGFKRNMIDMFTAAGKEVDEILFAVMQGAATIMSEIADKYAEETNGLHQNFFQSNAAVVSSMGKEMFVSKIKPFIQNVHAFGQILASINANKNTAEEEKKVAFDMLMFRLDKACSFTDVANGLNFLAMCLDQMEIEQVEQLERFDNTTLQADCQQISEYLPRLSVIIDEYMAVISNNETNDVNDRVKLIESLYEENEIQVKFINSFVDILTAFPTPTEVSYTDQFIDMKIDFGIDDDVVMDE